MNVGEFLEVVITVVNGTGFVPVGWTVDTLGWKGTSGGITADPATGGYWIGKSDGGVDAFAAPWYGSLAGRVPAGQSVTGIAGE